MIQDGVIVFGIIFAIALVIVVLHTLYFLALRLWRKDLDVSNIDQTDVFNIVGATMGGYAIVDAIYYISEKQDWAATLPITVFVMVGFGAYATLKFSFTTVFAIFRKNLFS